MYALLVAAAILPPVELRHLGEVVALWTRAHDAASWRAAAEQLDAQADSLDLAIAAVFAWRSADDDPPKPSFDDKLAIKPLTDRDAHLLHAIDVAMPLAFDRTWLLFNRGLVYYNRGHLDDAVVAFQAIVDTSPAHAIAEYAANLWLDALNRAQRYDELEDVTVRLRVDRVLLAHHPDMAKLLAQIEHGSVVTYIEPTRNEADRLIARARACASVYMNAFRLAPDSLPTRDELLYEAAMCSYRAGDRDEAIARFTRLRSEFPRSLNKVPEVGLVVPAASDGVHAPER